MSDDVREEITILLDLLKNSLIKNHISMATDNKGNIYFFDTDTYITENKMNGFHVNVKDMVK